MCCVYNFGFLQFLRLRQLAHAGLCGLAPGPRRSICECFGHFAGSLSEAPVMGRKRSSVSAVCLDRRQYCLIMAAVAICGKKRFEM